MTGQMMYEPPTEPKHECAPPMREVRHYLPKEWQAPGGTAFHAEQRPAGAEGSVWRCDCGALWTSVCDDRPRRGGYVSPAFVWRRSTWSERRRAKRSGFGAAS